VTKYLLIPTYSLDDKLREKKFVFGDFFINGKQPAWLMDHLKIVNKYFIETAVFMNAIDATGCPSNQSHWRKKILV